MTLTFDLKVMPKNAIFGVFLLSKANLMVVWYFTGLKYNLTLKGQVKVKGHKSGSCFKMKVEAESNSNMQITPF